MTASPTAQEALEALNEIIECTRPATAGFDRCIESVRSFIESAAAGAGAWAKVEAFCLAHPLCGPVLFVDDGAWFAQVTNEYNEQLATVQAPTRLAALQQAAAWCEKEGV